MRWRSGVAWGVLLQVVLLLALPFAAASATSAAQVPACCRRAGLHHCAGLAALPGAGWSAARCALWSESSQSVPARRAYALPAGMAGTREQLRREAVQVRLWLAAQPGVAGPHGSRGPPALG